MNKIQAKTPAYPGFLVLVDGPRAVNMRWQTNKRRKGCHNTMAGYLAGGITFHLLNHASDQTGGNGTATLTDVETLTGLSSDRTVGLEDHLNVVTGLDTVRLVLTGEGEVTRLVC